MTALPTIDELGRDLLVTTAKRRLALTRPLAGVALFSAAWPTGAYWLAPAGVFVTFLSVIAVTHDLVHGSPRPAPERARPDPLRPPRARAPVRPRLSLDASPAPPRLPARRGPGGSDGRHRAAANARGGADLSAAAVALVVPAGRWTAAAAAAAAGRGGGAVPGPRDGRGAASVDGGRARVGRAHRA